MHGCYAYSLIFMTLTQQLVVASDTMHAGLSSHRREAAGVRQCIASYRNHEPCKCTWTGQCMMTASLSLAS